MVTIFTKETATKGLLGSLKEARRKEEEAATRFCICVIDRYCSV